MDWLSWLGLLEADSCLLLMSSMLSSTSSRALCLPLLLHLRLLGRLLSVCCWRGRLLLSSSIVWFEFGIKVDGAKIFVLMLFRLPMTGRSDNRFASNGESGLMLVWPADSDR